MNIIQSYISIDKMQLFAHHGVLPVEQKVGNEFEVSLQLSYDASAAMENDDIDRALNYAHVMDVVKTQMSKPAKLLEHVAYNIVRDLNEKFPAITGGRLTVTKLHPPVSYQISGASFTISWTI